MKREQIVRAAKLAGVELADDTDLEIAGEDPIFESPFHLAEGAAVALGLVGQAADRLWRLRGNRAQSIRVDARHAAASLVSFALVALEEREIAPLTPNPLTAIHPCRDGRWIHLHSSFDHGPSVLAELGLPPQADAGAIATATARRDAFELEDALARRRVCGAVVRSAAEWAESPQGRWLAARPVVEVLRIGDAPPEPLPPAPRPLSGVRVLDLTRVLAGPTCARTLAEHGADALHVASPALPTIERFEIDTGHGKRQAWLDLREPAEAETLRELVRGADVFSQGFRLGALARRGFAPEQLAALRPGIIYVSENCYGNGGPWGERPGWEQLAQTVTGVAAVQGGEDAPRLAPAAHNDYTTGYFATLGAMEALRRRATEGGSWHVRVSLCQTSMWYVRLGHDLERSAARGLGDVAELLERRATPYGTLRFLAPPLRMSETQPRWELPTALLGGGEAVWVAR
jgi:crotonobetainyl-CoA:carnitine CoA-transferase CaiB-like acyl-CoA transferase